MVTLPMRPAKPDGAARALMFREILEGILDPRLEIADTLAIALDSGATKPAAMERVTIDTTVLIKAIAYPTDGHRILRAIERVTDRARQQGVTLRQSYARVVRYARRKAPRLLHGRGLSQGMRHLRKRRTWLGRVIRDVTRKIEDDPAREVILAETLERARRILSQCPADADKRYAFQPPR
ncbi:MAG: hypothetical protein V2I74_01225 [Erythrobacter sp.]|jgi:IS5 family transposase|nr:hypothetical protein [Erythrobacter sp.]